MSTYRSKTYGSGMRLGSCLRVIRELTACVCPGTSCLFFKALAMCEGLLQTIDPDSSFADYLGPMVKNVLYKGVYRQGEP